MLEAINNTLQRSLKYKIGKDILAFYGLIWIVIGVVELFHNFWSWYEVLAFRQAVTLLWITIVVLTVMALIYSVRAVKAKHEPEKESGEGFVINGDKVIYGAKVDPVKSLEELKRNKGNINRSYWVEKNHIFNRSPYKKDDKYVQHRILIAQQLQKLKPTHSTGETVVWDNN